MVAGVCGVAAVEASEAPERRVVDGIRRAGVVTRLVFNARLVFGGEIAAENRGMQASTAEKLG